ncbi:uncharacterized protein B0H64DRAFT_329848 [Chaetomium fimeti]|uniref:Insecticidal toxin complex protein n=1 Tax=Chaetomium fimeti TaxID=1854472 RepID=A0AAE0H8N0_9PEZI|nr:hypothetical protein B0H64DRAFT_329848 [Chaetomium fimeti]
MDDFWDLFGVKKDIIDAIQAFGLHDGHLLQWTIRYVAGKNYVDQPARRRLLLVADLVEICEDALFTMTPILLKDPNVHSLSDVAVAYYSSAKGMRDGHVIRPPLLYRVPTAVLRNVVANADNVMIDDLARKTLIRIMDLAVAEQFDARSGALSHFIAQPACKSELSQVPKSTALKVREDLETLYRLHPLVVDADDILPLMGLGYTSAHKIASLNQSDFMREAENRGIITERAERIYLEAGRIDRRNDAVWVDIVKARTDVPVLSMSGLNHATPSDDGQDTNLTALFNDLDTVATENSTSVLGPASYLVDLLQMLDRANLSIKTVDPWTVQSATSARDVFLHRRPDIATAHLSKVDTETPVAYQDLAIEIMEQYLSRSLGLGADQEADVYKAVSHYVAPMATFPYNHAIATSRQLLQARGYSRYELLRRFQSDWDLVRRAFPDNPAWETSVAAAAAENVHQRRLTAEILKLQPLDFQAITQEAFYSPAFVRLLGIYDAGVTSKTYEEVVGVRQGGEYWGYEAYASEHGGDPYGGATWKMVDSASEISLRLIKDQLLVRSGLSSSQLNMVLKTRYIGKRLVVTLAKDDRFSDRLQDMRLQESPLVGGKEVAGRLSKRTCLDLQAFIRLYRRLGWPIQTLDAAIGVLARRAQIYEDDDHYHHVLDVAFLERLAAAQQLSTRVDVPLVELLPLWGPMDAQFSTSLYPKLFLHPQLVQQYPLLVPLASGEFLPTATFGENMGAILHALHITHADLLTLMEITRQDARTSWNLETIAELYRHQKMSHFLDLPISQYPKWWEYCQTMANPFLDPQSTLTSLGVWLRLPEEIPSVEAVLGLNDDAPTAKHRERTAKDLAFIAQIVQSVADLSLDDQPVDFVVAGPVLVTQPQPLRQGQPSVLELSEGLSLKGLTYFTAHGDARFDETSAIPVPAAKVIFQHLFRLERGLDMTKTVNMGPIEVEYYQKLTVDFSAMNFDQMTTLLSFLWNRQQLGVPGASLVSYYQYLQRASGRAANPSDTVEEKASLVELVSETCRVTKLTTESVSLFFDLRWPGLSTSERVKDLLARDLSPLHQLADCCEMSTTLGIPISTLHEWAQAPRLPNTAEDFDSAKQLKASLLSNKAENALARARESLASTQRRVLQEALFRVPILQAKKITTPDSLSAELLIDTQMGPGIQTSRIAQAIDSVQRFVQRCLIGLEKRYGIATTGIDQQLWGWMNKYTLWQANRKVYLYPENWADPSLRDDKTQAFEELENKMLQASLNKDVVGQLLREYVYAVHEVADLDLQAYLWERKPPYCGNYHFFARTRAAPFSFYYRRLEARSDARGSTLAKWLPWEKMEVDIPTHATDGDHQPLLKPGSYLIPALFKNRLFLFLPQITPRTVPAAPPTGSMMELAKSSSMPKSPQKGWEIKMAWVEMRNGKWSPKYVTATGIDVMEPEPSPSGPLVSVESFNFSIEPTTSDKTLTIVVEKLVPDPESHLDLPRQIRSRLGCFEMQGMQLRLVGTSPSAAVSSAIAGKVAFSRMLRKESTRDSEELRASVENYEVGIDPEAGHHSMLAVPDPPDMAGGEYELSWLLSYDHSQFKGVSGLVVERSVPDQAAQFYVSYPPITKDGAVDTTQKTVDTTHSFTQDTSLVLTEEIADNQGYECIFDALESLPKDQQDMAFGYYNNKYSELATPSSVYNWEIGFHVVALLMERLLATQQFDLALEVSRMVFDPRPGAPGPLSRLDNCWRFFPFKSSELRLAGSVRDIIQSLVPGSKPDDMVDWEAHPFSPHPVARNRPAVYMKRFVMKIIEILIASGDQYFRQNSSESVGLATQRYVEASELFGPAPVEIDPPTKPVTKSYDDIRGDVNSFATAAVDMELEFPYFINPELRGYGVPEPQAASHMNGTIGFVRSTYFGVPANPQMQALRDLIDNRLFNIRNGLDIDGNPRRLPLFDQPLDPDQVASGVASGTSPSSLSEGLDGGPMPNYRARYLLQKALDLCGELRGFEDSCLSIRERRDSEAMANLRARQEVGVSALMTEIKQLQIQEATMAIATLQEARESHVSTLKYYLALMGESKDIKIPSAVNKWEDFEYGIVEPGKGELRMSPEEALESRSSDAAGYIDVVASGMECAGGLLKALPETTIETQPMGVGAATKFGASNLGEAMIASAGLVRLGEKAASEIASRAARKGQLTRQLQERKLSANMAAREIQSVDTQIATQKKQIEIAQAELRAHQQQVADTAEMEEWMRTKYTSEALYSWLEAQTRKLAYQTYLSALDMAKTAERAMMFEYGPKARSLLSNSYWDGSRDGMLAASQLTAALHRIEKFYMQNKPHDYELTKTISLRQVSPLALVDLRAKGVAEFELPEVLFDHDFPGHYCRRIQSVSLTIPRSAATVGPPNSATAVNCSLQLLEHRYRLQAGRATGTEYYRPDPSGNDARFHTDRIPISSVALSTCKDDSGTFQLDFVNSDRYVPFEGAGVVSKWKLELPGPFRQFDYATIGDVLVTVQYTALEGGAAWKKLASDAVREFRSVLQDEDGSGGAFLMVDIKADFPDEWKSLEAQLRDTKTGEEKKPMAMDLTRMLDMLPFWSVGQHVTFEKVWMTVQPAKGGWEKTGVVEALGAEMEEDVAKSGEGFKVLGPGDAKDVKDVKIAPVRLKGVMPKGWWVVVQYTQGK